MGKHKKKRQHLKEMEFETTPAQRLMRSEMEAGLHKSSSALAAVNPPSREHDASIVSGGAPSRLGAVLEQEMGAIEPDPNVERMAHVLIEEHGQGLQLGLKQWAIVQRLVEAGIRVDPRDL